MTRSEQGQTAVRLTIDDVVREAKSDERLVDVIERVGEAIPHVCYHPQLGPIQTCDTCMVEVNGQLVRACATTAVNGMVVKTNSERATVAQVERVPRLTAPSPGRSGASRSDKV